MNKQKDDMTTKQLKIGIADTMFARGDMGSVAEKTIKNNSNHEIIRYTVPGIKDLPVACRKLFKEFDCDIIIACGYVGGAPIDQVCAHEASTGIQNVQLKAKKHIIEVFVHETEGTDKKLAVIMKNRVEKHALNAIALLEGSSALRKKAGTGERQGWNNASSLNLDKPNEKIKLGIIVGEFNKEMTLSMKDAAIVHAQSLGCTSETIQVPGVFDMPLIIKQLMQRTDIDGIVLLGAVIKGETNHDDVISRSTTDAAIRLSLEYNKPIGMGIIGPGVNWNQAEQRGEEYAERAVDAVLRLIDIRNQK